MDRRRTKKETVLKPWQGNRSQFDPYQYSKVRQYFTRKKVARPEWRSRLKPAAQLQLKAG
jgi:hypothetical protein